MGEGIWSWLLEHAFLGWIWAELLSSLAMAASGVLLVLILRRPPAALVLISALALLSFAVLDVLAQMNAVPPWTDQQQVWRIAAYATYDLALVWSLWLVWRQRRVGAAGPSA